MSTLDRYSRQTLFGPIGKQGQERLRSASVSIIGCGALGTVLANNLCRAGIGRIVIADRDYIELNNLQPQILFDAPDITLRLPKSIGAPAGVVNGIQGAIEGVSPTGALKIMPSSEKVSRAMSWMALWENTSERIELPRQPDCPACGQHRYEFLDSLSGSSSTSLCGRNAVQVRTGIHGASLDLPGLAVRLQAVGQVRYNENLLPFVVDGY